MYKETIKTREKLEKVLNALDCLGKEYIVTKTITRIAKTDGPPSSTFISRVFDYEEVTWTVEEVSK